METGIFARLPYTRKKIQTNVVGNGFSLHLQVIFKFPLAPTCTIISKWVDKMNLLS